MKFLQDEIEEPNDLHRRICQFIEVQQTRETMNQKAQAYQKKIKDIFDRKTKQDKFLPSDLVLRWDARRDGKGKHVKFDYLWFGPFKVAKALENNTFILHNLDGKDIYGGSVNGHFLSIH